MIRICDAGQPNELVRARVYSPWRRWSNSRLSQSCEWERNGWDIAEWRRGLFTRCWSVHVSTYSKATRKKQSYQPWPPSQQRWQRAHPVSSYPPNPNSDPSLGPKGSCYSSGRVTDWYRWAGATPQSQSCISRSNVAVIWNRTHGRSFKPGCANLDSDRVGMWSLASRVHGAVARTVIQLIFTYNSILDPIRRGAMLAQHEQQQCGCWQTWY